MEYLLIILFSGFVGSMVYIVFELCRFTSTNHKKSDQPLKQTPRHR